MVDDTHHTQRLFLWCMGAIYLFAFTSLYFQIPGLFGRNGILPAATYLKSAAICGDNDQKCEGWASVGECEANAGWMVKNCMKSCELCKEGQDLPLKQKFQRKFTFLWFSPFVGLDIETGMELICIIGIVVSFCVLVFPQFRNKLIYLLLWALYLSVYQVGQTFLWFQWDILLLETGVLTIFSAPFIMASPTEFRDVKMLFWLVKWLLFRLMFASGVVKLTSRCPTWWGLTALNYHYESQCIPTPLSWYAHQLPEWFQKLSVVATYVIEMAIPFLFFAPLRSLRIFAFYSQVFLQVLIILTGNYNFFNLLTITLCLSLVDDKFLMMICPSFLRKCFFNTSLPIEKEDSLLKRRAGSVLYWLTGIVYGIATVKLFNARVQNGAISSDIAFSQAWFFESLKSVFPVTIAIGVIVFCIQILLAFYGVLFSDVGKMKKFLGLLKCSWFTYVAIWLFGMSLVPFSDLDGDTKQNLWPIVHKWHQKAESFHVTNSYGLFRSMTGVGGRPELIIEGSNDLDHGWKEYNFLYKPGNVYEKLPICTPHQPRLDWQMWFAALGSYQHNPWFVHLLYKLLLGQEEVLNLMAENPFHDKPPKYIRSRLYKYHYTLVSKKTSGFMDGFTRSRKIKKWWRRELSHEYTNPLSKDHISLKQYIEDMGWGESNIAKSSWRPSGALYEVLYKLRKISRDVNPTFFMLQLFFLPLWAPIVSKMISGWSYI